MKRDGVIFGILMKLRFIWEKTVFPFRYRRLEKRVRVAGAGENIRVCFFAMNVSMWKYSGIMQVMMDDPRFDPFIVLSPLTIDTPKKRLEDVEQMRRFFSGKGFPFKDYTEGTGGYDVYRLSPPDIAFYTQPYGGEFPNHNPRNARGTLLCYVPYCFWTHEGDLGYNKVLHKKAWKLFYPTAFHSSQARRYSPAGSKNVVVTGYPLYDEFRREAPMDPWKIGDRSVKRLIWAPHYSVKRTWQGVNHSSFLEVCDLMPRLLDRYRGRIQIAFKPHPTLKTILYGLEDWGVERTERYYALWDELPGGQLATGDYIDLFKTSDGLVHDSDSFLVEYLYTRKPAFFISKDPEEFARTRSSLGVRALDLHYKGYTGQQLEDFIDRVLFEADDPKRNEREIFYNEFLVPENTGTCATNVVGHILEEMK